MKKILPQNRNKNWKWIWIIWLLIVCVLSLMPTGSSFNRAEFNWPLADKLVHGVMYAVLSFTMLKFLQRANIRYPVMYVLIFCIVWGIGIEFLQGTKIISRDFEIGDIFANIIGSIAGIAITKYLKL